MKKYLYSLVAMLAVALPLTLSSCGDDDDDDNDNSTTSSSINLTAEDVIGLWEISGSGEEIEIAGQYGSGTMHMHLYVQFYSDGTCKAVEIAYTEYNLDGEIYVNFGGTIITGTWYVDGNKLCTTDTLLQSVECYTGEILLEIPCEIISRDPVQSITSSYIIFSDGGYYKRVSEDSVNPYVLALFTL